MRDNFTICVGDDGSLRYVADPALDGLAEGDKTSVRRASHVLPVNRVLRVAFRWLRDKFGEKGWVSDFTRCWPVLWQADLAPSGGPVLGPFKKRQDAIDAEIEWLEREGL